MGIVWWYLVVLLLQLFGTNTPQVANAFQSSSSSLQREKQLVFPPREIYAIPCTGVNFFVFPSLRIDRQRDPLSTRLSCGILDALQNAFGGGATKASKATASHILIRGGPEAKAKLQELKAEIGDDPLKFGDAAAEYSDCSSASKGGDLGEFEPGKMVKEFDEVVFDLQTPIGVVQGPIRTEFGYHLIRVEERTE